MAQTAESLITGEYAAFIPALSDRNLLLCLVGYYASVTSLTAQNCINGAKAEGYAALSTHDLMLCILEVI
jgi:hypothetical protein